MHKDVETFADYLEVTVNDAEDKIREIDSGLNYFTCPGKQTELLYFSLVSLMFQPKEILEIGSGQGITTRVLSNLFPESKVHTVDIPLGVGPPPPREENMDMFNENVSRENVNLIIIDSSELNTIFEDSQKFGVVFVDGDHTSPRVDSDLEYAYNHTEKDGFIFIHDYNKTGNVKEALERFKVNIEEEIYLLPFNHSGTRDVEARTAWLRKT